MNEKKQKSGLAIFIVIALLAAILAAVELALGLTRAKKESRAQQQKQKSKSSIISIFNNTSTPSLHRSFGEKYIARLYISGTIQEANNSYNQEWLLETIDTLLSDDSNMGIILDIDSPGGTVYEADEAYLKLLEYKEQKPVFAYFESLAASGGYYIGCAADYIMANRNSLTGSIGVISGSFTDLTGLFEKVGVKSETIHSGKNKLMGNYNEPVTEEQRAIMQSIADECYEQFTGIVAESRGLSLSKVKELADGRIYTARQAKQNGLIDDVGSLQDLVDYMCKAVFEDKTYTVEDYEYEPDYGFYNYFRGIITHILPLSASASPLLPAVVENAITPKVPYPAYYYEGY